MSKQIEILELLENLRIKEYELENLIYGSIEIRESKNKKYIYCHNRIDGIQTTKYIGEYSDVLYNIILSNNSYAKEIKKNIRQIESKLIKLGYVDSELSKNVLMNIDFAKRNLVSTIYTQAILEGVATTLSDTESIIEDGIAKNMHIEDIMKIINLKHAWEFILNKNVIALESDYSILCDINKLIEEGFYYSAGMVRSVPVKIGGTKWVPDLPMLSDIKEDINRIVNQKKSIIDTTIDLLLYVVRKQIFIDGNKRTAVVFANHYLISKGKGLIVIPVDKIEYFKELLVDFYETNKSSKIFKFLKEECFLDIKNI